MLAVVFDNDTGEGDLAYADGCLLAEGFDLETAVVLSLFCDAPALDGDVLPDGTPRRGWWADVYDEDGETLGSRLWLLEQAESTEASARLAKKHAEEALAWLTRDQHVRAIDVVAEVGEGFDGVQVAVSVTLKNGKVEPLGPFKVN